MPKLDDHALPDPTLESHELDGDRIGPEAQRRHAVAAPLVRQVLDPCTGLEVFSDDGRSREQAALGIAHDSENLSRIRLGGGSRGKGQDDYEQAGSNAAADEGRRGHLRSDVSVYCAP